MICYRAERYQSAWHSTRMISAKILNYTTKDTTPGEIHHHTRKSPQQILYHTRTNIHSGPNQGTVHWYILLVCQWKILIDTSGFPPHAAHWVIWSFKAHTAGWSAGLGGAEIRLSSVSRGCEQCEQGEQCVQGLGRISWCWWKTLWLILPLPPSGGGVPEKELIATAWRPKKKYLK